MPMHVSPTGLALIARFEGLRLNAYDDGSGTWTIGYGHTGPDVRPGLTITRERALELLAGDVREAEACVDALVHVPLAQCRFDALASLVFNTGPAPLRGTLGRKLNAGDYDGAADEFLRWDKVRVHGRLVRSPGLARRRRAETALFRAVPVTPPATV